MDDEEQELVARFVAAVERIAAALERQAPPVPLAVPPYNVRATGVPLDPAQR